MATGWKICSWPASVRAHDSVSFGLGCSSKINPRYVIIFLTDIQMFKHCIRLHSYWVKEKICTNPMGYNWGLKMPCQFYLSAATIKSLATRSHGDSAEWRQMLSWLMGFLQRWNSKSFNTESLHHLINHPIGDIMYWPYKRTPCPWGWCGTKSRTACCHRLLCTWRFFSSWLRMPCSQMGGSQWRKPFEGCWVTCISDWYIGIVISSSPNWCYYQAIQFLVSV